MRIKSHKHKYFHKVEPTRLIDCLDEKSLAVLKKLGYDVNKLKEKPKPVLCISVIIGKIRSNFKKLDELTVKKIKTMCYIGENGDKTRIIVRPFKDKANELCEYVTNHPNLR